MSLDILSYTKRRVRELEEEKLNIRFYEENAYLLLMPLENVLNQAGVSVSSIPVDFIFSSSGLLNDRSLRVFDVLGLDKTKVLKGMDAQSYTDFFLKTDAALKKIGLSINMKMNGEQRRHFDELAYQMEEDKPQEVEITSFADWKKIVKRIVFNGVERHVIPYLANKYEDVLNKAVSDVMKMCNNVRLSDDEIRKYIILSLESQGLELFNLREVDWESFEHFKRRTRGRK